MTLIIIWLVGCLIVGAMASDTTQGFWSGFLLSLILSPVIGFIIALFYPSKEHREKQQKLLAEQNRILQQTAQRSVTVEPKISLADELTKIEYLKSKGLITPDEFQKMRDKLMKDHL